MDDDFCKADPVRRVRKEAMSTRLGVDYDRARAYWEKALQIDPTLDEPWDNLDALRGRRH
jgi:hypothetical protein